MSDQRLFFIPDIHGRNDLLLQLLGDVLVHQANLDLRYDRLIFGGDMVDRGPHSREVIDTIRGLQNVYGGNVIALFGNHERMMVDAIGPRTEWTVKKPSVMRSDVGNLELWSWNGGLETLKSYNALIEIGSGWGKNRYAINPTPALDVHVEWLQGLPLFHVEHGFFFSHAPVPRENRRLVIHRDQPFTEQELTWTYDPDEFGVARDHGNGIVGVCGHIHRLRFGEMEPRFYPHYIFADAGCGCSEKAPLVAINVRTREVFYARPPNPIFKEKEV